MIFSQPRSLPRLAGVDSAGRTRSHGAARRTTARAATRRAAFATVENLEHRRLFADINVPAGGDIQAAIRGASEGDTIILAAGTYNVGVTQEINQASLFVNKGLTIRGAGAGQSIINIPSNEFKGIYVVSSNTRLEDFSVVGGADSVAVDRFFESGVIISNIVVKDLALTPNTSLNGGSGVFVRNADGVVIEGNTIGIAHTNSITIGTGSTDVIIKGNTLQGSTRDYSISLGTGSSGTWVLGNAISGSPNGIAITSRSNYIAYNTITGFINDGITLDRDTNGNGANFNVVANNVVESSGRAQNRPSGSGVFLNSESNYNLIFNNRFTGSVENGVALFRTSNNLIWGNEVTQNGQGGIFLNDNDKTDLISVGNAPTNNLVIENYSHDNITNGMVQLVGGFNTEISRNYLSATSGTLQTGIRFERSEDNVNYYNIVKDLGAGLFLQPDSDDILFARNRFINTASNHLQQPATGALDAGPIFGGNYYDNNASPSGNPGTIPYTRFIYDNTTLFNGHADAFPFGSETLGFAADAVSVFEPAATTLLGPGSSKTIRYSAPAAILVDIAYTDGTTVFPIATNTGNTGVYRWTVPTNIATGSNYRILVTPKNNAGQAIAPAAQSDLLSVENSAASALTILSPTRGGRFGTGQSIRVAWNYAGDNPVQVEMQTGTGDWTVVASNVTEDFADIALPSTAAERVRFRVRDIANGAGDTQDGYVSLRGNLASAGFTNVTGGATLPVGSLQALRWMSPAGSVQVDIDYFTGTNFTRIATGVPDFNEYTWTVPDVNRPQAQLRLTFRDASGNALGTADSAAFVIPGQDNPITFYGPRQNPALGDVEPPPAEMSPDLTVSVSTATQGTAVVGGSTITARVTVTNSGDAAFSGTVPVEFFLDTDTSVDGAAFDTRNTRISLRAGQSRTFTFRLTLPSDRAAADYFLQARVNGNETVSEDTTANNSDATDSTFNVAPAFFDFRSELSATLPSAVVGGSRLSGRVTVFNDGNTRFRGTLPVTLYLSTTPEISETSTAFATVNLRANLSPGRSQRLNFRANSPTDLAADDYFIIARVNDNSAIAESDTTDNASNAVGTVNIAPPFFDFRGELSGTLPASLVGGRQLSGRFTVFNDGNTRARGTLPITFFLSTTQQIDETAVEFGAVNLRANISPGRSQRGSFRLTTPTDRPAGDYFLLARIGTGVGIGDANTANNDTAALGPVNIAPPFVNLQAALAGTDTDASDGRIAGQLTVTNNGNIRHSGTQTVRYFLSQTDTFDESTAVELESSAVRLGLSPGASRRFNVTQSIPDDLEPGQYFIFARIEFADTNSADNLTQGVGPIIVA